MSDTKLPEKPDWTFFSNYAHVLVCVANDPEVRLRDIALQVGITERSAQRIINHLKEAGILVSRRRGRRNVYLVDVDQQLRHPLEAHCSVASLLASVLDNRSVNQLRRHFNDSL